jgi:hypothetical protein
MLIILMSRYAYIYSVKLFLKVFTKSHPGAFSTFVLFPPKIFRFEIEVKGANSTSIGFSPNKIFVSFFYRFSTQLPAKLSIIN